MVFDVCVCVEVFAAATQRGVSMLVEGGLVGGWMVVGGGWLNCGCSGRPSAQKKFGIASLVAAVPTHSVNYVNP